MTVGGIHADGGGGHEHPGGRVWWSSAWLQDWRAEGDDQGRAEQASGMALRGGLYGAGGGVVLWWVEKSRHDSSASHVSIACCWSHADLSLSFRSCMLLES